MRVLVCGGRAYSDRRNVFRVLDDLHDYIPITEIAEGGAKGADTHARMWAKERGVICRTFPADWHKYGNDAGPIRNLQMSEEFKPDLVVAFPGTSGTKNMVAISRRRGHQVVEIP